jgi:hypothetical protein
VKSFLSSLLFFSDSEYRFQECGVLVIGYALFAEEVVIDENQIQTADDERRYAIVRFVWLLADVGIAYDLQREREQTLRGLFNAFAQLWVTA